MNILLAALFAANSKRRRVGGVQSWTATIAREFRRIGHDVTLWCPEYAPPAGPFDFGIIANWTRTGHAAPVCKHTINVCHGIIPAEQPKGGAVTVFTSEGVKRHWGGSGPIIRQPIDLDFWTPGRGPGGLVRFSYYGGLEWLEDVAAELRVDYHHIKTATPDVALQAMRGALCVLATGRASLEAMACGAPVVILDDRPYQGPLLSYSPQNQMTQNYSGRCGATPTPETVRDAIDDAIANGNLRPHVERFHDSKRIAGELLGLY